MTMRKGVFLDKESINSDEMDFYALECALDAWRFFSSTSSAEVVYALEDCNVVVTNKVVLNAETILNAPNLELICIAATGTNNVDIEAAKSKGVIVCNVVDYSTPSVAQHVFTLILALATNLRRYTKAIESGRWAYEMHFCIIDYPIMELSGKTMGIIGYGVLGKAVANLAQCFGMKVNVFTRNESDAGPLYMPLHALLSTSDVVSLHCPLNVETTGLIGQFELGLMKPTSILINTARGGIVDELALVAALKKGKIAGAGVDVLSIEPPKFGNPLLSVKMPNLIVTPHIAWASTESRQRLIDELVLNINSYYEGTPRNVVY